MSKKMGIITVLLVLLVSVAYGCSDNQEQNKKESDATSNTEQGYVKEIQDEIVKLVDKKEYGEAYQKIEQLEGMIDEKEYKLSNDYLIEIMAVQERVNKETIEDLNDLMINYNGFLRSNLEKSTKELSTRYEQEKKAYLQPIIEAINSGDFSKFKDIDYHSSYVEDQEVNDIYYYAMFLMEDYYVGYLAEVSTDEDNMYYTQITEWKRKFAAELESIYQAERNAKLFMEMPDPAIGMTEEEVKESKWGEPDDINRTTTASGVSEQWVYSLDRYIYLEDGIVTAIQE